MYNSTTLREQNRFFFYSSFDYVTYMNIKTIVA